MTLKGDRGELDQNTKNEENGLLFPDRPTILVVDDDSKILEAFDIFLNEEEINMIAAYDVDEAIKKIKGRDIDLVITDFMLESKSSLELYTLVRKKYPDICIIVITGYPELISEDYVKMSGANYLLTKPLELNEVRKLIKKYCNLSE